jgi:superfamily II DNA or RNA helicase
VFGKVIESRKALARSDQHGVINCEIYDQFDNDVFERGLKLEETARISHINFGRESYFGVVTDASVPKGIPVHIVLDPKTKLLTRASCGCFRANTRSYCHHIVSFIRFVLRGDSESGGLRSLEEDFQRSFWYEISLYGYRHFGDSMLGFRAGANHGGEGLRVSFLDRSGKELLAFMPGERLVEEFLYEFYDLIRRDVDSAMFKRMYGRKLKDPAVSSSRRRPWAISAAEEELNRRGVRSTLQNYEESLWHRIAKVGFLIAGREGGSFTFQFLEHKQELIAEGLNDEGELIFRITPPRGHVGHVIELGVKTGVIGAYLPIRKRALKTSYRIDLDETSSLRITPIVENPDPDATQEERWLDRTQLEQALYGSYYYFPDLGFFKIAPAPGGLPPEYFAPQKTITVPADKITDFLDEFGPAIREETSVIADESLFTRQTVETYQKAVVNYRELSSAEATLSVEYDFGDFRIPFRELFDARTNNRRYIVRGEKWVDTMSEEFAWMDGVTERNLSGDALLTLNRTEYMRFLALHDTIEKKFESGRLKEWFRRLENLKPVTKPPTLKLMKGRLRHYQRNGYGWLWFLYENHLSGLLCDDMGLGKTHQIMGLMTGILQSIEESKPDARFLVICPTTVLSHWHDKVLEFAPHLDPLIYHGSDRSFREGFETHRLVITSYGVVLRDVEMLSECIFELVVLDEVQALKNKSTKTYAAVKSLVANCIVGLTGTPVENSLTDLKALFDVILPGYLMSDASFEKNFRRPVEEEHRKGTAKKLTRMIHPFTLRRTKEQVLTELPEKIEDIRRCSLSEDQERFYKDIAENRGGDLVEALRDPSSKVPYIHVFAVLNYLKQVCDHPALLEPGEKDYRKYASGKWELFTELLEECLGSGHKVVVFSQYVKMLTLIEAYLTDQGIGFAGIKGQTRKRAEAVKRFNTSPDCMVFSASLRASGLGIDLTGGSVVIHYDRWWNSAREDQATDRVHRIGQSRGVQVFKLVTENTLEEKIDRIIARKKRLMNSIVREDDHSLLKRFSREDLIELMSYR